MSETVFIDESLAKGLVNNWVRQIKNRNSRVRTMDSKIKLTQLAEQVSRGVPQKKRRTHYLNFINETYKARTALPYVVPLTNKACPAAAYLDVDCSTINNIETLVLTSVLIDYTRKTILCEAKDDENANPSIHIKSHHVLVRFLQRENTNELRAVLLNIYDALINTHTAISQREEGACNVWTANGGMLLGEVKKNQFGDNQFQANTYITSWDVRPHNLICSLSPYADVNDPNFKFMMLNDNQIEDLKRILPKDEFERVLAHNHPTRRLL